MEQAAEERDTSQIICNREAQHRYLTWRAEKVVTGILTSFASFSRYLWNLCDSLEGSTAHLLVKFMNVSLCFCPWWLYSTWMHECTRKDGCRLTLGLLGWMQNPPPQFGSHFSVPFCLSLCASTSAHTPGGGLEWWRRSRVHADW